jgi:hypothetical protein
MKARVLRARVTVVCSPEMRFAWMMLGAVALWGFGSVGGLVMLVWTFTRGKRRVEQ